MPVYRLSCEMRSTAPLQEVFSIFENPYNLAKITPPWLNFVVTSPGKVEMRKGAEIRYTIRWLGLPIRWRTVIEEYQPPNLFIDRQADGPYRLWHHRHTFEEDSQGIKINDNVDYALPFGPLGRLAHALLVKRQLIQIFNYRQQKISEMLPGSTVTAPPTVA